MGSKNSRKSNNNRQASKEPEVICEYEYVICKCPKPRQLRPPSPPPSPCPQTPPPLPRHARINNYRNESPECSGDESSSSRYDRNNHNNNRHRGQPQPQPVRFSPPPNCKKYYVEVCEVPDDRHHHSRNRRSITSIESIESIC